MEYTILGILLMILMLLYFKVADNFNIIDKPNQRSSHTEITLRGGRNHFLVFVANLFCAASSI